MKFLRGLLALLLSVVLVIALMITPVTLSAISLLDSESISEAITDAIGESFAATPEAKDSYNVSKLSNMSAAEKASIVDEILEEINISALEEAIGAEINAKAFKEIIKSEATREIVGAYVSDVVDALMGQEGTPRFNEDMLVEVVEENLDEIAEIIKEHAPEVADESLAKLKEEIKTAVRDNAGEIVKSVISPEEIRDAVFGSSENAEKVTDILAQKDKVKLYLLGIIVIVAALIFVLRMPGYRGLGWISADMFIAAGVNVLICIILFIGASAVAGLFNNVDILQSLNASAMISNIISTFTNGVIFRTVAMLVIAIVLAVLNKICKRFERKDV